MRFRREFLAAISAAVLVRNKLTSFSDDLKVSPKAYGFFNGPRNIVSKKLVPDFVSSFVEQPHYDLFTASVVNLPIQIIFLRLLGVEKISLLDLTEDMGILKCYLQSKMDGPPRLTFSKETTLKSIKEHTNKEPIAQEAIKSIANFFWDYNKVNSLYQTVGAMTDDEIESFSCSFFKNKNHPNKSNLVASIKAAREKCQLFIVIDEEESGAAPSCR
jgi:hypothetical protein